MSAKQQHHENAAEHRKAAAEEAWEAIKNMKESGIDVSEFLKEKILEGTELTKEGRDAFFDKVAKAKARYASKAEDAADTVKANVVTATSYLNDQAEDLKNTAQDAYDNANSVVGEYVDQAAETAKAGASQAEEALKSSKDKILNSNPKKAFLNTASKVKNQGEDITARIGSYISDGADSFMSQFQLGNDMSRAWKRFKSKLYTVDRTTPPERNDQDFIQDFVNRYFKGKTLERDPKELAASIYDTLRGSKDSVMDKIKDSSKYVKDQASDTYDSATKTMGNNSPIDYSAFTDAFNEAYEKTPKSPRAIWKSVYYNLSDSNHPLANTISKMAQTPIPITSLYMSLVGFVICYTKFFGQKAARGLCYRKVGETPKGPVQIAVEDPIQVPGTSKSFYNQVAEDFSWAPMAFLNILALELNGYSCWAVHSIAIATFVLEGYSRYCPQENQPQCKTAMLGVIMLSALFNFFTALTGFPVIG